MKLEIGYNHSFEIRKETHVTNCQDNFSVLYLSDLHLNKFSQSISERISATIDELNPTLVLLGGDYVDSQKGLIHLNNLLYSISHRQNIFAIAGNHDYSFGIGEIKKIMIDNNVVWLENKSFNLNFKNTKIKIDGNFLSKEKSTSDFSILLLHKPIHINKFKDNYNLALAGHLHGSQFVFWKSENKLYPGKFFYEWNILKTKLNNCQYFISKGLGDTLPIRYNCKRDLLFIQATNNN
ncbi:MAG: metallophosphoesterase [Saprospiraceae bacterium]|nr:metallophosphoesterase [Saprospiraceae bacterium]